MRVNVNQLKQNKIEAQSTLNALLDEQSSAKAAHLGFVTQAAKGTLVEADKPKADAAKASFDSFDARISAQRTLVLEAEKEVALAEATIKAMADSPVGETSIEVGADHATKKPWESMGHKLMAVKAAAKGPQFTDQRLFSAASGANETVDADGGFLVGTEDGGTLLEKTYETGILTRRVRKAPVGAGFNGAKYKLIDETSRANGSRFGGIQAYWGAEAAALTASQPKLRDLELKLKKLHGLMYMTDELLEDAVALEGFVNEWFPQEFGFKLDDAIFAGTGGGIPLGILNCPAVVEIAKETGQAADTVVIDNIYKMYAAMPASSLAKAEWYINVAVWPQLFKLVQTVGTGGAPIFIPGGNVAGAPFGTLLGRPITPIEQASALGDSGDIVFADLSRYLLADKGSIKSAVSMHVKFLTDEMAYRWTLRIDGTPIPNSATTPFKGTQTLSPFVKLAAR